MGNKRAWSDSLIDMLRSILSVDHHNRASIEELLQCDWLQNNHVMTDQEMCHFLVKRNLTNVQRGIEWSPKHSDLLTNSTFYAQLVGQVQLVKDTQSNADSSPGKELMMNLGLSRYVQTFPKDFTIEDLAMIGEEMKVSDRVLLAKALIAAEYDFAEEWLEDAEEMEAAAAAAAVVVGAAAGESLGCQCDACQAHGKEIEGCQCGGAGACSPYCQACSSGH